MKIEELPRFRLAEFPTPLDELVTLGKELGLRIWMKRDDLSGFALGGNKVRKLEFLAADALEQGADVLITGGGPQSNHTRVTAAAARKAGLEVTLVLAGEGAVEREVNGNLLLEELLGAEVVYTGTEDASAIDGVIERVAQEKRGRGRRPYVIPRGGSTVLGCVSYILAVGELLTQLEARGARADQIYITTGSCGTQAGVLAGLAYYGSQIPVQGITVSRSLAEGRERIRRLVSETAQFLGMELPLTEENIRIDDAYLGEGYAKITPAAREAIRVVARLEGIFLDPVYTGKTMAGLIDKAQRGEIPRGSSVVFWHTGGAPGLFGFAQDVRG